MKQNQITVLKTVVAVTLLTGSAFALAGAADGTFATTVNRLTGWLTGTMGQMFAVGALAVGLGIGIVKQSVMSVAIGIGIALAASQGPAVLVGIFALAI